MFLRQETNQQNSANPSRLYGLGGFALSVGGAALLFLKKMEKVHEFTCMGLVRVL